MKVLHTEASKGWGGQEMRILNEALGMRKRGHEIFFALQKGALLIEKLKKEGFYVYEVNFYKKAALKTVLELLWIFRKHKIDIVNTHSSLDGWIAGFASKIARKKIIRTRHLSTKINSKLVYHWFADHVVTTSKEAEDHIRKRLPDKKISTVATGVDPERIKVSFEEIQAFRNKYQISIHDCLVGTCCVLRGWKGIHEFLLSARQLSSISELKWIVVGAGVSEEHFLNERKTLGLEEKVIFTGHLENPYVAIAAMDIFLLLSWAHEGISQSSLQAAYLKKPLVTTGVGGLKEVCLNEITGLIVPPHSSLDVSQAVKRLFSNQALRQRWGQNAHDLVSKDFTKEIMLDKMDEIYKTLG